MGNYRCRKPGYLSARQLHCVEAVWQGKSDDWIAEHIFDGKRDNQESWRKAKAALANTKRSKRFEEYYNSLVTEFRVRNYGKAMSKISELVDSSNPWVALQAANSMVSHTEKVVVSPEENAVTVKIEGLPTLGEPVQDGLPAGEEPLLVTEAQVV